MPVTRDKDFPNGAAQLMQAFNHCADGHDMETVIQAAANMLSAALHTFARAKGMSRETAIKFFTEALDNTSINAQMNFDRDGKTEPGDVKVLTN